MLSFTEENYLKAVFHLSYEDGIFREVGTNELAAKLLLKPATVNNMLKKLKAKDLIYYEKYGKLQMTDTGVTAAKSVIRKHRLWETFLYQKLEFTWDEVHEVAEELEHIKSEKLIKKLDQFLKFPKFDPHGDPIPNELGEFTLLNKKLLSDVTVGEMVTVVAVKDNSSSFLKFILNLGLEINDTIKVLHREEFDSQTTLELKNKQFIVSAKFAENIFVI